MVSGIKILSGNNCHYSSNISRKQGKKTMQEREFCFTITLKSQKWRPSEHDCTFQSMSLPTLSSKTDAFLQIKMQFYYTISQLSDVSI